MKEYFTLLFHRQAGEPYRLVLVKGRANIALFALNTFKPFETV